MLLSKPSSAARTSLFYITLGALMIVWCGVWYVYLHNYPPDTAGVYYWCTGFLVTGLTLLVIGLALGRIGRAARHAELPPEEVIGPMANAEQSAAARAPIIAPVNPAAPAVVPNAPVMNPNAPVAGAAPAARGATAGRIG
jgi:hypothetical protein